MAQRFRPSTDWIPLEVLSEPYVVLTFRGYTAAVAVREMTTDSTIELLLGGIKSLAEGMEPIRVANGGTFTGMRFQVKKESDLRTAPYLVEQIGDMGRRQPAKIDSETNPPKFANPASAEDKLWQRILRRHRN